MPASWKKETTRHFHAVRIDDASMNLYILLASGHGESLIGGAAFMCLRQNV
jgi:hypothetical protein